MGERTLMKGNEALAEAAIRVGCRFYAGYPITPQSEISEYMSRRMPLEGGVFIPAESEIGAINMVLGAGATGNLSMTSTSSCAMSLMQETIGYMVGSEVPAVIVNVSRGGPGLGTIAPSQGDYFQAVKGGANGDFRIIVLAPSTIQEMVDLTGVSFYLSQKYRNPVIILGDGMLGQMAEPIEFKTQQYDDLPEKDWNLTGAKNRPSRCLRSIRLQEGMLEEHNYNLFEKYALIEKNEQRVEVKDIDDADLIVTSFGSSARIAKTAISEARKQGLKVGLIRPITLWPFPSQVIENAADKCKLFLDVEMNMGQMIQDVKIALNGKARVEFLGRPGGSVPTPEQILDKIKSLL